jgi:hypothetical protein
MKAVGIEMYGNPIEIAKSVEAPDVGAPAVGEVVIQSRPHRSINTIC